MNRHAHHPLRPLLVLMTWCCAIVLRAEATTFAEDAAFLGEHTPLVTLGDGMARILVAPALQGRVLTSTAEGPEGAGFGWINRALFAARRNGPHINAYGGEDRLWLGPEGGQFALFFPPGAPFTFASWQTPPALDTEPFAVVAQDGTSITLRRELVLPNYSRTVFSLRLERQVRLLGEESLWRELGMAAMPGIRVVAYESRNRLTNAGDRPWERATGLLSLWVLGMFNAAPSAAVIAPFQAGSEAERGPIVESSYFGAVPQERLQVCDGYVLFRADARQRGKIGLSPRRARPVLGAYDAATQVLTVIQFPLPAGRTDYVNSQWKMQEAPFSGDAANSYNDGPNETGHQLGDFFEMESSSPALALQPGETHEHCHRTIHLRGPEAALTTIARQVLGADLREVRRFIAGSIPR